MQREKRDSERYRHLERDKKQRGTHRETEKEAQRNTQRDRAEVGWILAE